MRRLFEYLFFISPFVLGVFYGLSPQIASVVFGPPFRDSSAQVMPWIATAVWIFGFKSYYLDVVFQLKKKTKIQSYTTALMAVISILSTYFFVMHDGIRGAAIAAVVSFTIGALTSYAYGRSEGLYTIGLSDVVGLVVAVGLVSFAARVGVATAQGTEFVALITGCAFAFAASVVAACALDVAGCRTAALTFLRRRK
jgi:O-antigen/teichoic acid export membrane protein